MSLQPIQVHIVDLSGKEMSRFIQIEVDLETEKIVLAEHGNKDFFVVGAGTTSLDSFGAAAAVHWWRGAVVCNLCNKEWQGVMEIPRSASQPEVGNNFECPSCGTMSGEPVTD